MSTPHVWIVEIQRHGRGIWRPCWDLSFTKREALSYCRDVWQCDNSQNDAFRVRKYARVEVTP